MTLGLLAVGRLAVLVPAAKSRQADGTQQAAADGPSAAGAVVRASRMQMLLSPNLSGCGAAGSPVDTDVPARNLRSRRRGRSSYSDGALRQIGASEAVPSRVGMSGLAADAPDAAHGAEFQPAAAGAVGPPTGLGGASAARAEATIELSVAATLDAAAAKDAAATGLPDQRHVAALCSSRAPRLARSSASYAPVQTPASSTNTAVPDATGGSRPMSDADEDQITGEQGAAKVAPAAEPADAAPRLPPSAPAGPALAASQSPSVSLASLIPAMQPRPPVPAGPSVAGAAADQPVDATTGQPEAAPTVRGAAEVSRRDAEMQKQKAAAHVPAAADGTDAMPAPPVQATTEAEQPTAYQHPAQAALEADKVEVSTSAAARKALQRLRDAAGAVPAQATPAASADRARSPPPRCPETASRATADQQMPSASPAAVPPPAQQPSPPPSPPLPQPTPPPVQKQHTMRNVVLAVS